MAPVIRSNVDKYFNCEDIFQAAMVADLTQRPPIKVVNQKEFDCKTEECTGNRGISQGGGHKQKRDHCVRQMRTLFGYNPLVESTFFGDFYGNILENKETCAGFMKGN